MVSLVISPKIREKLDSKHGVKEDEIVECFLNHGGNYLIDTREEHRTIPPTLWFIGETYKGRKLKVIFVHKDGYIYIKSAYTANKKSIDIYTKRNQTGE